MDNFVDLDPPGLNTLNIGGPRNKKKEYTKRDNRKELLSPVEARAAAAEVRENLKGPKRALQRIEEQSVRLLSPPEAAREKEISFAEPEEDRVSKQGDELRETIDQLRLELMRETLARKELETSMKSILSEMDEIKMKTQKEGGISRETEKIQIQFRDVQASWSTKFNQFQKEASNRNEFFIKEVDAMIREQNENVSNKMEYSLKQLNDMLYWYYGVVKNPDGIDIVSKENCEQKRVLHKAKYGEILLLQPPMQKYQDGSIKMSCRMVDEGTTIHWRSGCGKKQHHVYILFHDGTATATARHIG